LYQRLEGVYYGVYGTASSLMRWLRDIMLPFGEPSVYEGKRQRDGWVMYANGTNHVTAVLLDM
jgi:hypothetical protein